MKINKNSNSKASKKGKSVNENIPARSNSAIPAITGISKKEPIITSLCLSISFPYHTIYKENKYTQKC